jgi:hypothetical protein
MPEEGMQWLARSEVPHLRGVRAAGTSCSSSGSSVDGLRLTGGEPTVRAHLPVLVEKLAELAVPESSSSPLAGRSPTCRSPPTGPPSRLLADELRARPASTG